MVPSSGDEFASFIDLPDLDIDFTNIDGSVASGDNVEDSQPALKSRYIGHDFYSGDGVVRGDGILPKSASATDMNMLKRISGLQVQPGSYPQAEHHTQVAPQHVHFHNQGVIPPTPTSLDLHGNRSHFTTIDPHHHAMYEAQLRKQQQEVSSINHPPLLLY